jgi:electron transport complex protein RnfG
LKKLVPSLVLILICGIFTALLVIAHDLTYKDETGIITDEISASLNEIYGESGDFSTTEVRNEENGITMIMENENADRAYLMTVNGYSKGGITLVVGLSPDGSLKGISIVSLSETPGLGTKVDSEVFLSQFAGFTADDIAKDEGETAEMLPVRWGTASEIEALKSETETDSDGFALDAITGATLSSNGVYEAVKKAVTDFSEENGGVS